MTSLFHILAYIPANHPLALLVSLFMLILSATFSSCETSLFSLTTPELNRLRASPAHIDRIVAKLHGNLKTLLPTILFCNMAVNVLIFALSAAIATGIGGEYGAGAAFAFSLASLFMVVFFGEVFPKQLAISSSLRVARLTSLPVWLFYRLLAKPMRILNAIVTGLERIFVPRRSDPQNLREEELRLLVEQSRKLGVISAGEYMMIDSIVELPEIRIRDFMIPRVDIEPLAPESSLEHALEEARRRRHCKLPVLSAARDDLAGWVDVRDIFSDRKNPAELSEEQVEFYLREFHYFSEHDRADQVLEAIKKGGRDLFAVVDERGMVVGFFTLQDIMDEVLGRFGEHGAPPPSEIREQRGMYILSGRFSSREWRDIFNVTSQTPRSATVGGMVVALLGRLPRVGDVVEVENMTLTVLSTWHNRVGEVGVKLVRPGDREKAEKKVSSRFYVD